MWASLSKGVCEVRIIAGTAKGRRLEDFTGRGIRPTPDRVREALFSALFSRVGSFDGYRVLDLFAGTGALGLEALSRGAAAAVLVDQGAQSARLLRANIQHCGFSQRAEVITGDVLTWVPRLLSRGPFDLVFLDPPYGRELVPATLERLTAPGLLGPEALVCAEAERQDPIPDQVGLLQRIASRNYGISAIHTFIFAAKEGFCS